jgi:hypothetical protein
VRRRCAKNTTPLRLECATAGSFKTCLRVKMGDDAVFASSPTVAIDTTRAARPCLRPWGRQTSSSVSSSHTSNKFEWCGAASVLPPLIIIKMHPFVMRDLALLCELDHVDAW